MPVRKFNSCSVVVKAISVSSVLSGGEISGIMGLAFPTLSKTRAVPFWNALATSYQLTAPEMSFYLERHITDVNLGETASGLV